MNVSKRLFAVVLSFISLSVMASEHAVMTNTLVHKAALGNLGLLKDSNGYSIIKDQETFKVADYDVDKNLKKMSTQQFSKYLVANGVKVEQYDNGDYKLSTYGQLKGGGAGGATAGFWVGKIVGYGVCVGVVATVTLMSAPVAVTVAGPLGAKGLMYAVGGATAKLIAVEKVSNTFGLAGGILGAVASGPA